MIGLISAIMFFYTEKGGTISVIGMFIWLLNILQGIVLFFVAQSRFSSTEIVDCNTVIMEGGGKAKAFSAQQIVILFHLFIDYLRIIVVVIAVLYAMCCIDAQFGPGKPRHQAGRTNAPNADESDEELLRG